MRCVQSVEVEAKLCPAPDFDVFDQNIGSCNHGFEPRQILRVFQINRNACLPLICAVEIGSRFVSTALDKEGTQYAGVISFGAFDLDHIGPQICQSLADPRPCEDAGQFDDFQALQSYVYFNPMFFYTVSRRIHVFAANIQPL